MAEIARRARLLERQQLDVEQQRGVRGNYAAGAAGTVTERWWNHEPALTACLHSEHALVPTANHFACPHLEAERIVAVTRAVELLALVIRRALRIQPACVVNDRSLAHRDRRTLARLNVCYPQSRRCRRAHEEAPAAVSETPASRTSSRLSRCT